MILPGVHLHAARFQVGKTENGILAVHEHAHVKHVECGGVVAVAQLLDVGQIEATRNGILHGDDVAPLAIRAEPAAVPHFIKQRKFDGRAFLAALFPLFTCPERVRLVCFGRWRGKVGGTPFVMGGHRAGHLVQFCEVGNPEIFVTVKMATV